MRKVKVSLFLLLLLVGCIGQRHGRAGEARFQEFFSRIAGQGRDDDRYRPTPQPETLLREKAGVTSDEPLPPEGLLEEIQRGFSARVKVLGFGIVQGPVDSPLNPSNLFEIPRYQTEIDLRPDFDLNFRRLELSIKPRLELEWQQWQDGVRSGSQADEDIFLQEGFARYRVIDPLFLSYGRENLQWGPSYLISASNPFSRENGRNNPQIEVPALDYGRVIWLPTDRWTVSFIANTGQGRQQLIGDFKRQYAIKLDYTGEEKYFTLIPSYREDRRFKLGFFGGLTVSDALLLYAEGSLSDHIDRTDALVGGSYTLELGPTIALEYFHNEDGCLREHIDLCFPPFAKPDPADVLFRRNYLMLQYLHTRIWDTTNVVMRWTHNLDDHSSRIVNILEYDLGDRTRLFAIGNIFPGNKNTEFGSLLDYSIMLGLSYTL